MTMQVIRPEDRALSPPNTPRERACRLLDSEIAKLEKELVRLRFIREAAFGEYAGVGEKEPGNR